MEAYNPWSYLSGKITHVWQLRVTIIRFLIVFSRGRLQGHIRFSSVRRPAGPFSWNVLRRYYARDSTDVLEAPLAGIFSKADENSPEALTLRQRLIQAGIHTYTIDEEDFREHTGQDRLHGMITAINKTMKEQMIHRGLSGAFEEKFSAGYKKGYAEAQAEATRRQRAGEPKKQTSTHETTVDATVPSTPVKRDVFQAQLPLPRVLKCPITNQIFDDPVVLPSGQTVERRGIESVINKSGTNPFSGEPLHRDQLYPNHTLKRLLAYLKEHRLFKE